MNDDQFASLKPALLARKGAARPAMQPFCPETVAANAGGDMASQQGHGSAPCDLARNAMRDHHADQPAEAAAAPSEAGQTPSVRDQQDHIKQRLSQSAPAKRKAGDAKRNVAFTLRIDPERHAQLRLACAIENRSAQQFVIEALDAALGSKPEIATLAAQLPRY